MAHPIPKSSPDDPFAQRPRYFAQVKSQLEAVTEQIRRAAEITGGDADPGRAMLIAAVAGVVTELRIIEDLLVEAIAAAREDDKPPLITLARPS